MTKNEIKKMVNTCNNYYSCALCPYNPEDISRFIGDRWKGGCSNNYAWERGTDFPISYYSGCSDTQEKLAEKIQKCLRKLNELLMEGRVRHKCQKQEVDDLCDME